MIVDIGGGTTEVALISCSGIIYSRSSRIGGDTMDEALIHHVRRTYSLLIGDLTAERIKIELGGLSAERQNRSLRVKGRDLVAGSPKTIELKSDEVRQALAEPIAAIVDRVRIALEGIPPETSADIAETGIVLVGGGCLLANLQSELHRRTGLPVERGPDPLATIVLGAGRCLEDPELLHSLALP